LTLVMMCDSKLFFFSKLVSKLVSK
jgi:hypothetical protein